MANIWFNKVKENYGWLGNMAPYRIRYKNTLWLTSEALFQALRFDDPGIQDIIREEKSPMGAKMKAKKYKDQRVVEPMSEKDVENMRMCVKLKFDQHPKLRFLLSGTEDKMIYEDIGSRNGARHKFWGAKKITDQEGDGLNMMGVILMELRDQYRLEDEKK